MLNFSMDVNQDGWIDQIRIDFPGKAAYWPENPKNKKGHWKVHTIFETVGHESPRCGDVDGDGRKELLCADSKAKEMNWLQDVAEDEKQRNGFPFGGGAEPETKI